ncbi:hypothetical protein [Microbacter margulisiae]|uniref:Lipoprotein n=1 Tax=Microbacter margulisiae TaxID=1350067 RepID=A0A7W5DQD2_9PORP|nr:hypothetical protein [Microbacter margulisiae]MBB3186818.1 hypothetical protein [Microbacter margulisiae]
MQTTALSVILILLITSCSNPARSTDNKQGTIRMFAKNNSLSKNNQIKPDAMAYKPYKTIITNLNNDNVSDTIFLSSSLKSTSLFNKITIIISGFCKEDFITKDSWTDVDSSFLKDNRNYVSTKSLFIKKTKVQTVILLFGMLDGAGYRENFSIINISDNKPKMVFNSEQDSVDVEIPVKLVDLEHNGKLNFIFRAYSEEDNPPEHFTEKGTFESYTPFWVYTIDNDCQLNKPLTKQYNEEHYVFAGFKYNHHIEVFTSANNGGKKACLRGQNGKIIWLTKE